MTRLALFDLNETLLSGDSDALWGEFLMDEGLLDRADFAPRNADMALRYREADVSAEEFCEFYVAIFRISEDLSAMRADIEAEKAKLPPR